jgi:hypothetical protein
MKKLILSLAIILCGCATTAPVVTSTQVQVPVATQCTVVYPTPPANYLSGLKSTDSILTKGNAVIAQLDAEEAYAAQLLAALQQCATPAQPGVNAPKPYPMATTNEKTS